MRRRYALILVLGLIPACFAVSVGDKASSTEVGQSEGETSTALADEGDSGDSDSSKQSNGDELGEDGGTPSDEDGGHSEDPGCELIACDPGQSEDDCDPDEKCTPWSCDDRAKNTDSTRCVQLIGDQAEGEPCLRDADAGNDDCAAGLFCMPDEAAQGQGGAGRCIRMCSPEPWAAGNCHELGFDEHYCLLMHQGSLPTCQPLCDPLAPACDQGLGCYFVWGAFVCMPPESSLEDEELGKLDQRCVGTFGCEPGASCINELDDDTCVVKDDCFWTLHCGCCRTICELNDPSACEEFSDKHCVALPGEIEGAKKGLGFCVTAEDLHRDAVN